LQWVKSSYNSVRGRIVINWSRERGRLVFEIIVPANTRAEVYIPTQVGGAVTEGGKPVVSRLGIKLLRNEQGIAVFEVASGRYHFEVSE
jgi:alpha-L-rhamnosidase